MVTWLSPLTGLALPSSKCVATRGLSLRSATLAGSTPITLVDSEGSLAPVAMRHAHSLLEREAAPPTTAHHYYCSPPLLSTGHWPLTTEPLTTDHRRPRTCSTRSPAACPTT